MAIGERFFQAMQDVSVLSERVDRLNTDLQALNRKIEVMSDKQEHINERLIRIETVAQIARLPRLDG